MLCLGDFLMSVYLGLWGMPWSIWTVTYLLMIMHFPQSFATSTNNTKNIFIYTHLDNCKVQLLGNELNIVIILIYTAK